MPLSAQQIRSWIVEVSPPGPDVAAIRASAEHIAGLQKMRALLARSMCEATAWFNASDADGNGLLDRDEFRAACEGMRFGVPDSVTDELFDEIDVDGSNGISEREYVRFVLRDTISRKAEHVVNALWKLCQPMAALEDCTNLVGKVQVRARALGSSPLLTMFERLTRVLLALTVCWPSCVLASRQFRRAIAAAGVACPDLSLIDEIFDSMAAGRCLTLPEVRQGLRSACASGDDGKLPGKLTAIGDAIGQRTRISPKATLSVAKTALPPPPSFSTSRISRSKSTPTMRREKMPSLQPNMPPGVTSTSARHLQSLPMLRPPPAQRAAQLLPMAGSLPQYTAQSLPVLRPPPRKRNSTAVRLLDKPHNVFIQ